MLRPAFCVAGLMLCALGFAMLLAGLVETASGGGDSATFYFSGTLTLFVGVSLAFVNRLRETRLSIRQGFLVTSLSWILIVLFASLPLRLSDMGLTFTDALFESTSGLTTTGATIIMDLSGASRGVLIWRSMLQWIGGIGIIVTALAVLPMLSVGGMQLFRTESSDTSEKILPRSAQFAGFVTSLYCGFTLLCAGGYWLAGMTVFESVAHAMTTVATGGFSTSDLSIGYWRDPVIDGIAIIFMVLGSLPFIVYLRLRQGDLQVFLRDTQLHWFFALLGCAVVAMWVHLQITTSDGMWRCFRLAAFNVTSVMTGTGYATADYGLWSGFATSLFFFLMFVGGCAGSTACGVKIFRLAVVAKAILLQLRRMLHPRIADRALFSGRVLEDDVIDSVMHFLFFYLLLFTLGVGVLSLIGLAPITAFSAAASALNNVGPGLGDEIGPAGNFTYLPDAAKWLLAVLMLLGRLEVFTILVLFSPTFWRK